VTSPMNWLTSYASPHSLLHLTPSHLLMLHPLTTLSQPPQVLGDNPDELVDKLLALVTTLVESYTLHPLTHVASDIHILHTVTLHWGLWHTQLPDMFWFYFLCQHNPHRF
jgi:hypothetical protein